jgi:WD40 repeat protein
MTEKRKNSEKKQKNIWAYLGWLVLSLLWFGFAYKTCHLPDLADYSEIINYTSQLSSNSIGLVRNPFFIFVVSNVLAFILLRRTKKPLLFLFMIPFEAIALFAVGALLLGCDGIVLRHLDSQRFDGKTFHLTHGYNMYVDDDILHYLFLYECTEVRNECRGRRIDDDTLGIHYNSASLTVENNQLLVLSSTDTVLFIRDSTNVDFSLPNLEPLTLSNIALIESLGQIQYESYIIQDMQWMPNEQTLVITGESAIWFHEFADNSITTRNLPVSRETGISISHDGNYFASTSNRYGGSPTTIRGIDGFMEIFTLSNSGGDVDFSVNGQFFAAIHNQQLVIYDMRNFTELGILNGGFPIEDLQFSPDSRYLAAAGGAYSCCTVAPQLIRVWDVETQEPAFYYSPGYIYSKQKFAFSPDSQYLAVVNPNDFTSIDYNYIRVFDIQTETEVLTILLPADVGSINSIVWSQDGTLLIASSGKGMSFWNAETGELVEMRESEQFNYDSGLNLMALNSDGTLLAIEIYDGSIQFWGVTEE